MISVPCDSFVVVDQRVSTTCGLIGVHPVVKLSLCDNSSSGPQGARHPLTITERLQAILIGLFLGSESSVWRRGRRRLRERNDVNEPAWRRAGPSPRGMGGRRGAVYLRGVAWLTTGRHITSVPNAARAVARIWRRPLRL